MRLGPPQGKTTVTPEEIAAISDPSPRVEALRGLVARAQDQLEPLLDLYRPYVEGLEALPRDGRFLLVGNHTQFMSMEILLIPHYVRRELGVRVRPLAERGMGQMRGVVRDLMAAYGGVVGHPDTATELMRHDETVLVFPGGGREIAKFKGEEYQLRWEGRSGFARVAIANEYPIVPVGLVGGDDVYRSVIARDSALGRLSQTVSRGLSGRDDMAIPLMRGVGPTLLPRPTRMYLRFAAPIDTTRPADMDAAAWESAVKGQTQASLEAVLADLQQLRDEDPFRSLDPRRWHTALQPAATP